MRNTSLNGTPHGETRFLEPGKVYTGTVEATNPITNTCVVRVDTGHYRIADCVWGSGIVSGMLGMKTNYLPPPNTRVLLVYGPGASFIVGSTPSACPGASGAQTRTHTGQEAKMNRDGRKLFAGGGGEEDNNFTHPAVDMLEGEFELSNLMGVGITLLTNLAKLSAGDLAKIEVCLLNDMVRIVSQTFKHYHALGNFEIYNDGRLNARWAATSYEHESYGKETSTEPSVPISEDQSAADLESIDALNGTLRERFSQFVGFLGDFINTYVTDPATTLGAAAQARSGKFRLHVNNDGSLIVQSVADIVLERVCRIVVPIERKRWDDPKGTTAEGYDELLRGPLKTWQYDNNPENMFHAAYQLRHYARWLTGLHGLARFHQNAGTGKDWEVPTETATPAPKVAGEEDKAAENPNADEDIGSGGSYIDAYACIRIMRDGSIVMLDGYGSTVTMAGGNVQVAATKHLTLEAAGDVNIVAGQNMNLKARRSIEVVAAKGGLTLKARAWFRALSEHGSMWLRSDAPDPASDGYVAPTAPTAEDPVPEVLPSAIVIQSSLGRFNVDAKNAVDVLVRNQGMPSGQFAGIKLSSPHGTIKALAFKDVELSSQTGFMRIRSGKEIVVSALRFMNFITAGVFDINNTFTVRPGGNLDAGAIKTKQLSAATLFSRKMETGGVGKGNHTTAIPTGAGVDPTKYAPVNYGSRDGDNAAAKTMGSELRNDATLNAVVPAVDGTGDTKPRFNDSYGDPQLLESLAQQRLRLDNPDTHGSWAWSGDALIGGMRSDQGIPWPGKAPQDLQASGGASLHEPLASAYKDLANSAPALQKSAKVFRFLKNT